jgi:hypothetical protein
MFRSYDHLQADIFSRTYSTDNGSVVFRILVIVMNDLIYTIVTIAIAIATATINRSL